MPDLLLIGYGFDYGEIFRIVIAFRKEGIFVHKGVCRVYKMEGGQEVNTSKPHGFNLQPKPWFNPVIEANIGELDQIIHMHYLIGILRFRHANLVLVQLSRYFFF